MQLRLAFGSVGNCWLLHAANEHIFSPGLFQPIAADDVAAIIAEVALAAPHNGLVEIAGPERAPLKRLSPAI